MTVTGGCGRRCTGPSMTDLLTLPAWAALRGVDDRNARKLAQAGRITGAVQIGRGWFIPADAPRPPLLTPGPKPKA
jgi:hypothetical protein